MLRFVGYIEIGKRETEFQGEKKLVDKCKLVFEVFGPKYPVREVNGEMIPVRVTVLENLSMFQKSNFYNKIFLPMRGNDTSVKHIAQLLGRPFRGELFLKQTGQGRTIATLQNPQTKAYSIAQPVFQDPATGETRTLDVPPAISTTRCFLWEQADKLMWDSIFIPGVVGNRSNNVFQEDIKQAVNYPGSRIQKFAESDTATLDGFFSQPGIIEGAPFDGDPFGQEEFTPPPPVQVQPNAGHFQPGRFKRS